MRVPRLFMPDNNRIEQDHRADTRMCTVGFKSTSSACAILVEMIHMMRKQQAEYAFIPQPSLTEQVALL
jgi:transposase-like protein